VTNPGFFGFLTMSLSLLERELPSAYAGVVSALDCREVSICVDGAEASVRPRGSHLIVAPRRHRPCVDATTTRETLRGLLDARWSLAEAVWEHRVLLRGRLEDLVAFCDALDAYFRGAVRCPSFPALLDRYLG
jgi:hypothetical protein